MGKYQAFLCLFEMDSRRQAMRERLRLKLKARHQPQLATDAADAQALRVTLACNALAGAGVPVWARGCAADMMYMFRQLQGAPNFKAVYVEHRGRGNYGWRPLYAEEAADMGVDLLPARGLAFLHVDVSGGEKAPWDTYIPQEIVDRCSVR